jgi:hypothetical protein
MVKDMLARVERSLNGVNSSLRMLNPKMLIKTSLFNLIVLLKKY